MNIYSDFEETISSNDRYLPQTRREGGVGGKLPRALRRLGAPPSLRSTKIHPNAPFKKNSNIFSGPTKSMETPR